MSNLAFGDYCEIEQLRHGVDNEIDNEMYLHKVIGVGRSNTYVTVPVEHGLFAHGLNEQWHSEVVDVVRCVCVGVDERKIYKYAVRDVVPCKNV